jgi:rod shape-determining protein MreD
MTGSQPSHGSSRILRPAQTGFIWFSLLVAFGMNLLPFGHFPGIPDWFALTLCFWCIHQPLRVGMATGFVLGIATDVAHGGILGQHALAYVLLAYGAAGWSRRILWFPLARQAVHVLPMQLAAQLVMLLVAGLCGRELPGVLWLLGSFVGTALWSPLTFVLLTPQYRPESKDVHRPI